MEISYDELLQINQSIFNNRYKEICLLGKGSFGKVIKSLDLKLNKEVAIKIINKYNNEQQYDLFREEIKILKTINHPNIVKLYDYYETNKNNYIIMEYIKGGTLKQYLEKYKIINESKVKEIIFYLLNAIEHLHKNFIIHRDIKLDNIMLENENNLSSLKIIDFGLSMSFNNNCDNNENTNNFCGTILYLSPELLNKNNVYNNYNNKERDIWAVGIIMYQLLYNKHPFHNKGESFKIFKKNLKNYVVNKNIIFHDEINKINRKGKKLICQLLEPDWTKRINANFALKKSYFENFNKSNYLFDLNILRNSVMEEKKKLIKKGKELLLAMIFLKNYNNNSNLILRKNSSKSLSINTSITTNDNSYIFFNSHKNNIKKGFINKLILKNKVKYYLNNKNNFFIDNNNNNNNNNNSSNNNNNNNKIDTNIFNKKSSKNNKLKIKLKTARNPTKIINNVLNNKKYNYNNNYRKENENNNICITNNYHNNIINKSLNINCNSLSNNFYLNKDNYNNPFNIQTLSSLENKTKYSKNNSNKNIMNFNNKKYCLSTKSERSKKVESLIKHKTNKKIENIIFPIIPQN